MGIVHTIYLDTKTIHVSFGMIFVGTPNSYDQEQHRAASDEMLPIGRCVFLF